MDLEKSVMYILIVDSILKWNWECQWFEVSIKNPFFSFLRVGLHGRNMLRFFQKWAHFWAVTVTFRAIRP